MSSINDDQSNDDSMDDLLDDNLLDDDLFGGDIVANDDSKSKKTYDPGKVSHVDSLNKFRELEKGMKEIDIEIEKQRQKKQRELKLKQLIIDFEEQVKEYSNRVWYSSFYESVSRKEYPIELRSNAMLVINNFEIITEKLTSNEISQLPKIYESTQDAIQYNIEPFVSYMVKVNTMRTKINMNSFNSIVRGLISYDNFCNCYMEFQNRLFRVFKLKMQPSLKTSNIISIIRSTFKSKNENMKHMILSLLMFDSSTCEKFGVLDLFKTIIDSINHQTYDPFLWNKEDKNRIEIMDCMSQLFESFESILLMHEKSSFSPKNHIHAILNRFFSSLFNDIAFKFHLDKITQRPKNDKNLVMHDENLQQFISFLDIFLEFVRKNNIIFKDSVVQNIFLNVIKTKYCCMYNVQVDISFDNILCNLYDMLVSFGTMGLVVCNFRLFFLC